MPKSTERHTIQAARRMPNGRLGIVERTVETQKKLTKAEQMAQATAMMHRRLFDPSASISKLADDFGLEPATVSRRLALARTDGVPDEARQIFIREMLPASMAVLQEVLSGDDRKLAFQAAKLIIEGLKAIELPEADKPAAQEEETLELFRERIKVIRSGRTSPPSSEGAIDASIVQADEAAPPQEHAQAGRGALAELPLWQRPPIGPSDP
jgi:hypothetical protein